MREQLQNLIREGTFSGVAVGSTQAEVRDKLGKPEDVSVTGPEIWKYGDLQVTFAEGRVILMALNGRGLRMTLPEVQRLVEDAAVTLEVDPALTFDTQAAFTAGARASVIFDADGTLDKVTIT